VNLDIESRDNIELVTDQMSPRNTSTPDGPFKDPANSPLWTEVVKRGRRKSKKKKNVKHERCFLEH
jgi:hypothetical protein